MPVNRKLSPYSTQREWKEMYDLLDSLMVDVFNVREQGLTGDGTTDDTAALQSLINSIGANGGVIFFPPGTYKISSTLVLGNGTASTISTRNGIRLIGSGQSKISGFGATNIKWAGGAGRMFLIEGPIQGVEIGWMNIECENLATIGIEARSVRGSSFHDLCIHNHTLHGFAGVVQTSQTEGSFANSMRNVQIASLGTSAAGIILHGDPVALIDWTESTFDTILIFYHGGAGSKGLWLGFSDGNLFNNLHVIQANAGAGPTILFDASIAPVDFPSGNTFVKSVMSNNGIAIAGTPGENTFFGFDELNGAPIPQLVGVSGWTRGNKGFGRFGTYSCRATRTSALSISDNTLTVVTLPTEAWDTHTMHSINVDTSRIVVPYTGLYRVTASVTWASNSTNQRQANLLVNGASASAGEVKAASTISSATVTAELSLTANDYVELQVFQNSGGALNLDNASLTVSYVGRAS